MASKSAGGLTDMGLYGLGVMGQNLALNVAEKGFNISVSNRSESKVDTCVERYEREIMGDEAFAATAGDVEARRRQGGATRNPLKVGYVGLRCVHCNHLPLRQRVKAAEAYPSSVSDVALVLPRGIQHACMLCVRRVCVASTCLF